MSLKRYLSTILLFAILASLVDPAIVNGDSIQDKKSYIIRLKDNMVEGTEAGIVRTQNQKLNNFNYILASLTREEAIELAVNSNIAFVEPDWTIETASLNMEESVAINNETIEPTGKAIQPIKSPTNEAIKIALLDTGINMVDGLTANSGISFVSEEQGLKDINGHGTEMARIIQETIERSKPSNHSVVIELYNVKVMNQNGHGYYSQVLQALDWAITENVDVVIMGFVGLKYSNALAEVAAVANNHGITLVAPAGNDNGVVKYPAKYNHVLGVAAVTDEGRLAAYSSHGSEVEFLASGQGSLGSTVHSEGTSFAAARVAASVALLKARNTELDTWMATDLLRSTGSQLRDSYRPGASRIINVDEALNQSIGFNPTLNLANNIISPSIKSEEELPLLRATEWHQQLESEALLIDSDAQSLLNEGYTRSQVSKALQVAKEGGISLEESLQQTAPEAVNSSSEAISEVVTEVPSEEVLLALAAGWEDPNFEKRTAQGNMQKMNQNEPEEPPSLQNFYFQMDEAPYKVNLANESISTLSGGLSVNETDFVLPGRNGLSFALTRTYDSGNAQLYEPAVGSTTQTGTTYTYSVSIPVNEYAVKKRYMVTREIYHLPFRALCDGAIISTGPKEFEIYMTYGPYLTKNQASQKVTELTGLISYEYTSACVNGIREGKQTWGSATQDEWTPLTEFVSSSYETRNYSDYTSASNAKQVYDNSIGSLLSETSWSGSDSSGYIMYKRNIRGASSISPVPSGTYTYPSYYNTIADDPEDNIYPIGKGWSWNIPYFQNKDGKTYLHLQNGSTYEIENNKLKHYPWEGTTFTSDTAVTVNGVQSSRVLKSLDGMSQHFSSDGRLIRISDLNGNSIEFHYTQHATYGKVLTVIKDAINNTINISYSSTEVALSYGTKQVTYKKVAQNGKELLSQVIDPLNRTTTYSYQIKNAHFNLKTNYLSAVANPYALLTEINHPTGALTEYIYEGVPVTRYVAEDQTNQAYRLQARQDKVIYTPPQQSEIYNLQAFMYTGDMLSSYAADYNFSTTVTKGNQSVIYTNKKDYMNSNTPNAYYNTKAVATADGMEQVTDYTYNEVKRWPVPLTITSYVRDPQANTQSASAITTRTYDDYGNLLTETDPLQSTTSYTYDSTTKWLATVSTPSVGGSLFTTLTRNTAGSITQQVVRKNNSSGQVLQQIGYEYDNYGNATAINVTNGSKVLRTEVEYNALHGYAFPTKVSQQVTNIANVTSTVEWKAEYDKQTGLITKIINGTNHATLYQYDKLGRLTRITHPDQAYATMVYNNQENSVKQTDENGNIAVKKWNPIGLLTSAGIQIGTTYLAKDKRSYDAYGRLIEQEDAIGNLTAFSYDGWGRLAYQIAPDNAVRQANYDDVNRTTTSLDGEGNGIRKWQDVLGRTWKVEEVKKVNDQIQLAGVLETVTFDAAGNLSTRQDGKNNIITYTYDMQGRLAGITNALSETTSYNYDMVGNLLRVYYPDQNVLQKVYDERGLLIKQIDPSGQIITKEYNKNGQLAKFTNRNGSSVHYGYNTRGFLTSKAVTGETITYTYKPNGARATMSDGTGTTIYNYEVGTGFLKSVEHPDGREISYTYNLPGQRVEMEDPFGNKTFYTYDEASRLETVGNGTSLTNMAIQATYSYFSNGALKEIIQANQMKSTYGYNGLDLVSLTHQKIGGPITNTLSYSYDGNKNIISRTENQATHQFVYDSLDRVSESTLLNESYGYDSRGNRQILETSEPQDIVDATYEYDAWDRLIKVVNDDAVVEYAYNGDGLLVERTKGEVTTRLYYDDQQVIAEGQVGNNGQAAIKASYTRGIGLINRIDGQGDKSYYLANGHGDIVELRDANGVILNQYSYDIWGNPLLEQEQVENPWRYSGEYWDSSADLQYLRARWYDPSMGRFINEDTYEGQIDNPLTLNLYLYVANNPVLCFLLSKLKTMDISNKSA